MRGMFNFVHLFRIQNFKLSKCPGHCVCNSIKLFAAIFECQLHYVYHFVFCFVSLCIYRNGNLVMEQYFFNFPWIISNSFDTRVFSVLIAIITIMCGLILKVRHVCTSHNQFCSALRCQEKMCSRQLQQMHVRPLLPWESTQLLITFLFVCLFTFAIVRIVTVLWFETELKYKWLRHYTKKNVWNYIDLNAAGRGPTENKT